MHGWYRDLQRYGTVLRAALGSGFERTIQHAAGMAGIRQVLPFPHTPGHARY